MRRLAGAADGPRVKAGSVVRWPLLTVAISLGVGVLLHDVTPVVVGVWLIVTLCFVVAALIASRGRHALICVGLASLSLGVATAQQAHYRFAEDEIGHYATRSQRFAFVRLRLVDPPRLLASSDLGRPRSPRLVAMGEALAVKTWDGWRPAGGGLLVRLPGDQPSLAVGDELEVFGVLERPAAASNPGQFDFAGYYRGKRVLAGISVDSPDNVRLLRRSTSTIDRFWQGVEDWRVEARQCLVAGFGAEHRSKAQLLRAMLLGDRDPAMSDIRDAFRDSGTSHYLAVSGLHVGIVGGAAFVLARLLRVRLRWATLIAAAVVAGYAVLAVPSPPILRATILALAVALGVLTGRRAGGVQLVSLAAVILLVFAPLDLYRAGFQLSFVTVLALVLFAESFRRRLGGRSGEPVVLATRPQLILAGRWLDNRILNGVAAAIVAWVASMPLVALHFGQFNPWAVPASLAAAPFVALSLLGGVVKIGLTYFLPGQAELWATLAGLPVGGMHAVVDWFATLPRANVPLPPPSLSIVVAFYACLLLIRVRWQWATARWLTAAALATCFVLIFVAPFLGSATRWRPDDQELRVTVLAVGAGQCVVLESPGGDVTLIDAGSMSLGDPLGKAIEPFLRHRGHVDVDRLVLSHANFDHDSAAADVVA
ncbi:MAG: ComEC/Rec2 family competence protein, partial [Planctomycetota bacterium]